MRPPPPTDDPALDLVVRFTLVTGEAHRTGVVMRAARATT
jgi:hypothetical protein